MPSTDPNQSPAPEPEDFDFSALESAQPPLEPDALEVLQPYFAEHCRRLGVARAPTVDEATAAEVIRRQLFDLFGNPNYAQQLFFAQVLEARGIDCWQGGKALSVLEGFHPSSGIGFAIPLDLARSNESAFRTRRFWNSPDFEQISGPAALLVTKREGDSVMEVDTMYSDQAIDEIFHHALFVARTLHRQGKDFVQNFGLGSVVVEILLDTVQLSHEAGDINVPVEGERLPPPDEPAHATVLGLSGLEINRRTQTHRVGIIALDPRSSLSGNEHGLILPGVSGATMVQKHYEVFLPIEQGLLEAPIIQGLSVERYRAA